MGERGWKEKYHADRTGLAKKHVCGIYDTFHACAGGKCNDQQAVVSVDVGWNCVVSFSSCRLLWCSIPGKKNLRGRKLASLENTDGKPLRQISSFEIGIFCLQWLGILQKY